MIQKHWLYHVWDSADNYLGLLPNVKNDFVLIHDINSAGPSPIKIVVGQSGEVSSTPVKYITTEAGDYITTEDDRILTTEGEATNYAAEGSMIRNGNIIKIVEVSEYYPSGKLVYTGRVKRWSAKFGSEDNMTLFVKPLSTDTMNHLVKSVEVLNDSQTSQNTSYAIYGGSGSTGRKIAYMYNATAVDNISSISLTVASQSGVTPATITVRIFKVPYSASVGEYGVIMDDPNNATQSVSVTVTPTVATETNFKFTIPAAIVPYDASYSPYGIQVESTGSSGTGALVYLQASDVKDGTTISNTGAGWQIGTDNTVTTYLYDFYFKIYTIPPYTKFTLTDFVASTMLKTIINNYISEGGIVSYDTADIGNTGESIPSYTFSVSTVLEGINAMLDFAPKDWYFTIDPGTNMLTFKMANTTAADYVLTYRKEIQELEVTASIESIKNSVYFTGGDTGSGTNLFLLEENTTSQADFGIEIDRITDNRITNSTAGTSKATKYLDKHDDEAYETPLRIPDSVMDISLFENGQTIGFQGYNSLADNLIIPIVRIERYKNYVDLWLGQIPYRESTQVSELEDKLLSIQTVDNPTSPS